MELTPIIKRLKKNIPFCITATICLLLLIGVSLGIYAKETTEEKKSESKITIIVDAGHGGIDPGKVSETGVKEKDLNLAIATKVAARLEKYGYNVIMTRTGDASLAEMGAKNQKRSDMDNRIKLINDTNPACLLCIHQNSYTDPAIHGAQVFYQNLSAEGQLLAQTIQSRLISEVEPENKREAKPGDSYYILKKSSCTSVIVECGFLSNPEETIKLSDEAYQDLLVNAICAGLNDYYMPEKNNEADDTSEEDTIQNPLDIFRKNKTNAE